MHVRLGHLDVVQTHDGIELDRPHFGALAHDLLVDLAFRGHVDDGIAIEERRAGEAPAGLEASAVRIALLDGAEAREPKYPSTCGRKSTGSKSMAFMAKIQTKMVKPREATKVDL